MAKRKNKIPPANAPESKEIEDAMREFDLEATQTIEWWPEDGSGPFYITIPKKEKIN